ncbi:MAG: formimidoylglutamase [Bacteroidia bacterium]|nr:formimidoylglutamase [Bacteroidia bacterium]
MEDFLSPIPSHFDEQTVPETIGGTVVKYITQLPDWQEADLALIGVTEGRGSKNKETATAPDQIRKRLYKLISCSSKLNLVDLGNIKAGKTFEDTEFALSEVCRMLLAENIVPIILGGTRDLAFSQFRSFQTIVKNLEMSMVSSHISLDENDFLNRICLYEPNYLFNINALGYQSHYVPPKVIGTLQKMYFNPMRLGVLRNSIPETEPLFRNTDMAIFDIGAVKQADAPGNYNNNPSGMTSEEICQLCWYAGISEKLRSFGLYEINPEFDYRNTTSKLGAQMIWYFLDGYYNRKGDHPELHNEFLKYRCTMISNEPDVVFYKSKRTERWWMEIPGPTAAKNLVIPCSYSDYTLATKGEMPDLFFKALQKNLK